MVTRVARQLPPMPAPSSFQKVNPADQPIMFFDLESDLLPYSAAEEYAQTISQRISMLTGVAQVTVVGSQKYAVRVDVDPQRLAAHSIGIDEVGQAISSANANLPSGTIFGPRQGYVVQVNGQLFKADAYASTIITYRNGSAVRLNDVAHVYDGVENERTRAKLRSRTPSERIDRRLVNTGAKRRLHIDLEPARTRLAAADNLVVRRLVTQHRFVRCLL